MSQDSQDPSNAEILTALQGMWGQQKELVQGVERRLTTKLDETDKHLDARIDETEKRLGERLAQEIQDRPVVVHVDMSRVTTLEKQIAELAERLAALEARVPPPT